MALLGADSKRPGIAVRSAFKRYEHRIGLKLLGMESLLDWVGRWLAAKWLWGVTMVGLARLRSFGRWWKSSAPDRLVLHGVLLSALLCTAITRANRGWWDRTRLMIVAVALFFIAFGYFRLFTKRVRRLF
jgi:hypothetical protein